MDTVDKIQHCTKLAELSNHSEFDLVRRIFNQPKCNQQVVKIAAHKDPKLIQNPVERYHCLGNMLADKSAVDMCLNGEVLITKQFQEFHSDHKQQETHLRQLFDLHLCLQKERAKVSSMQEIKPVLANEKPAKTSFLEDSIRQWCPQGPLLEPPDVVTRQWLEFSAWGRQVSFVILQWLNWILHGVFQLTMTGQTDLTDGGLMDGESHMSIMSDHWVHGCHFRRQFELTVQ